MTGPAHPARLDVHLAAALGISRTAARGLVDAGRVRVGGRVARAGQRVGAADEVVLEPGPGPTETPPPEAEAVELRVVLEDEWLAVVDKPAGLVVHPAAGHPTGTLADGLRQRGSTWSLLGGAERAGIVHRLDRHTSGLLVVAKTERAHRALAAQLASRTLGRTYWTLVWGRFTEDTAEIDAPIGRDPRNRLRMAVMDGGRSAQTDLRVLERLPGTAALEVRLRTGRTHQIRVHLADIGRPVVGDPLYGRRGDPHAPRTALHAVGLHFRHPADGRDVEVASPLPDDLVALLERARADAV
ncbi:MAG TPA: RluA family pseudouridine synthase [Candidatus Dormibacteraeota bacterium]|nr:RluA family pseudouridine synthase [Candidatus Dormibacteraeota bacterium]